MNTKSSIQLILEKNQGIQNLTNYIEQYLNEAHIEQGLLVFKEGSTIFKTPEISNGDSKIYTCIRGFHLPFKSIQELVNEVYEYGNGILLEKGFSIGIYDNRENKQFYLMEGTGDTINVFENYGKYLQETGLDYFIGHKKIMVYNEDQGFAYL